MSCYKKRHLKEARQKCGKIKINYIPQPHCICGMNEKAEMWQQLWGLTFEKMFPMFCGMFFFWLHELTCLSGCGKRQQWLRFWH